MHGRGGGACGHRGKEGDPGAQSTKAIEEESWWKGGGAKKRGRSMNPLASLLLCKC